ncbi:MAG: GxxExxY protein [Armatimonadetes bacterium]|nr:GxxExxY protein [Armatimonadota bacterium]
MTQEASRDPRTHAIIGAAMQVHSELGCGFLEAVYQEALALEFDHQRVPFSPQVELPITYRGRKLRTSFRADFICFDEVVVEVKALAALSGADEAQGINYLRATGLELALLLNFGANSLEYRRLILSERGSVHSAQSAQSADD